MKDDGVDSSGSQEEGPGIRCLQIVGDVKPGNKILCCGYPIRGTSVCMFQWIRHYADGTRHYIEGATHPEYVVSDDDVDNLIAVECLPIDKQGRQGDLVSVCHQYQQGGKNKDIIATVSACAKQGKLSDSADRFCRRFSLAEIHLATRRFSETHLIGNGGFGRVYKGQIDNGKKLVAIKRLAPDSNQGAHEFVTEIETLSKLQHINLVSLIGFCSENGEMILVYYIPRGTLADHLHSNSSLSWKQRLSICTGAARGLDYLHTGTSTIHRDVKSTNILLDENFIAKVSDFGLAKHLSISNSKTHISTIVKGTFGYLDPSYFLTCRLTRKSDTYAFGVVLLEVLSGRAAVDPNLGEDEMSLVMWAEEKISKGKVEQIVASNLREEISADCLKTFVGIAKRCLNHDSRKRPTMAEVIVQLELTVVQQDRKATKHQVSQFLTFWNRVN